MRLLRTVPLLVFLVAPASASEPSSSANTIKLGGFDLKLGMSQTEVIKNLTTVYDVKYHEEIGGWMVTKLDEGRPAGMGWEQSIGSVYFSGGKLKYVQKEWDVGQTQKELAQAIFDAAQASGGQDCLVAPKESGRFRAVLISCGGPSLQIMLDPEGKSKPSVVQMIGQ
jgi:hypothetical protein